MYVNQSVTFFTLPFFLREHTKIIEFLLHLNTKILHENTKIIGTINFDQNHRDDKLSTSEYRQYYNIHDVQTQTSILNPDYLGFRTSRMGIRIGWRRGVPSSESRRPEVQDPVGLTDTSEQGCRYYSSIYLCVLVRPLLKQHQLTFFLFNSVVTKTMDLLNFSV